MALKLGPFSSSVWAFDHVVSTRFEVFSCRMDLNTNQEIIGYFHTMITIISPMTVSCKAEV